MLYHNYDYFREQRVERMPEWMKAERYQFCERYPDTVKQESMFSKIKNFFKRNNHA